MTVTETLGALGGWELELSENTPDEVMSQLGYFGHLVVVDGPADVAASGNNLLAGARYVGVCSEVGKPGTGIRRGEGLLAWISEEDGKNHYIKAAITLTNATLAQTVTALLPPTVTLGTVNTQPDPAQRYTGVHQFQSRREALDIVCGTFGVEYRVNTNFTVDVGTAAQLYDTALPVTGKPSPIIMRRGAPGSDIDVAAIAGAVETQGSARDYSTEVLVLGQTVGTGDDPDTVFVSATATAPSVPYKDPQGNAVKLTRVISQSAETDESAPALAQLNLNRFNRTTSAIKVTAADYDIDGTVRVGDAAYVYDPDSGILDTANQVLFHGEVLHPAVVRVVGDTWPIVEGQTVAWKTDAGVWIDLTRWVLWETGQQSELTVGDRPKKLVPGAASNPVQDRVDAARTSTKTPKTPTGLSLATSSAINPKGTDSAVITATWNPVTQNTDNTTVALSYYELQYRPAFRAPTWTASAVTADTTVDLAVVAALGYDVRLRAVSTSGKVSAWTGTSSITSAADSTAPGTPSDPVLEPYFGLLRIKWDGLTSTGAAMPADFNRVDVHVSATSGFTASAATLKSSASTGGIVGHVDAPYGATRFVKLIAYDHNGNPSAASAQVSGATVQVADGDVASLNVGKLVAGIMSADVTISGRFATALTGARVELNALGLQKWDASNNLLVSITGSTNLLTGIYQTALSGRRIEVGSAGLLGDIKFYAPDGTQAFVRAYTESAGVEAVQYGLVIPSTNGLWNRINFNSDEWANYRADKHDFQFGASAGYFIVRDTTDKGVANATGRLLVDGTGLTQTLWSDGALNVVEKARSGGATHTRVFIDGLGPNWFYHPTGQSFNVRQRDTGGTTYSRFTLNDDDVFFEWAGTDRRVQLKLVTSSASSPSVTLFNASNFGGLIKYHYPGSGAERIEARDWADTSAIELWASAFTVVSSAQDKTDIQDATDIDALARIRAMTLKRYRRRGARPVGSTEDVWSDRVEIGFIAEQAPDEIRTDSEDGPRIDLYRMGALQLRAAQQVADLLDTARTAIVDLRGRVKVLETRVGVLP